MTLQEIKDGIIVGLSGGISAGFGIWLLDRIREQFLFNRHERRIITFLREEDAWHTTYRIASEVNLTEERVRFVCSTSQTIRRNQVERETWTLR